MKLHSDQRLFLRGRAFTPLLVLTTVCGFSFSTGLPAVPSRASSMMHVHVPPTQVGQAPGTRAKHYRTDCPAEATVLVIVRRVRLGATRSTVDLELRNVTSGPVHVSGFGLLTACSRAVWVQHDLTLTSLFDREEFILVSPPSIMEDEIAIPAGGIETHSVVLTHPFSPSPTLCRDRSKVTLADIDYFLHDGILFDKEPARVIMVGDKSAVIEYE